MLENAGIDVRSGNVGQSVRALIVNGDRVSSAAATLADLLRALDYGDARVATAVNGTFVPTARRAEAQLADGDRVEIVAPRQGG
jgi:sulfur carrier protein